jgi:hypothetical protein
MPPDRVHVPVVPAASIAQASPAFVGTVSVTLTPWTVPAHMTMLTGLPPEVHDVTSVRQSLSADAVTLAEVLQSAGYDTAAFVSGPTVMAHFGFGQGFALFNESMVETRRSHAGGEPIGLWAVRALAGSGAADRPASRRRTDAQLTPEPPGSIAETGRSLPVNTGVRDRDREPDPVVSADTGSVRILVMTRRGRLTVIATGPTDGLPSFVELAAALLLTVPQVAAGHRAGDVDMDLAPPRDRRRWPHRS